MMKINYLSLKLRRLKLLIAALRSNLFVAQKTGAAGVEDGK